MTMLVYFIEYHKAKPCYRTDFLSRGTGGKSTAKLILIVGHIQSLSFVGLQSVSLMAAKQRPPSAPKYLQHSLFGM
jgi:hypothetical protein